MLASKPTRHIMTCVKSLKEGPLYDQVHSNPLSIIQISPGTIHNRVDGHFYMICKGLEL